MSYKTSHRTAPPHLAPEQDRLYARLAFDTINAALRLGDLHHSTIDTVIATARRATIALTAH